MATGERIFSITCIFESMEMNSPVTIGKVADILEIPTSTARQYVKDFRHTGVFSDAATPPPGQTRLFTDDDEKVMWTIKVLRAQRKPTEEIENALIAGERFYPEAPPDAHQTPPDGRQQTETPKQDESPAETFLNALTVYQDQVVNLQDLLLEAERAKGEADKRAAVAEKELEIMRKMLDNESKKRWWKFWD